MVFKRYVIPLFLVFCFIITGAVIVADRFTSEKDNNERSPSLSREEYFGFHVGEQDIFAPKKFRKDRTVTLKEIEAFFVKNISEIHVLTKNTMGRATVFNGYISSMNYGKNQCSVTRFLVVVGENPLSDRTLQELLNAKDYTGFGAGNVSAFHGYDLCQNSGLDGQIRVRQWSKFKNGIFGLMPDIPRGYG